MTRQRRRFWVLAILILVVAGLGHTWWRHRYPFGWSHCCDKQLSLALREYADTHGGSYPAGGPTPEASLGLLYPDLADANLLSGKTVPEPTVRNRLESGGRLDPENCGWHYVEGLRATDAPGLALCWDKAGLGHNGERLEHGGHFVIRVGATVDYIPGKEWDAFLREEKRLRTELGPDRVVKE